MTAAPERGPSGGEPFDPVEAQVSELTPKILCRLGTSPRPISVPEIAADIGHHTTTPWSVVFALRNLTRDGEVQESQTSRRSRLRYAIAAARPMPREEGS